jgi:hypothetical protein
VGKVKRVREGKRRRCIFCGRLTGDPVDPRDPNSRKVRMSEEHLFRESWQGKLVTGDSPEFERVFTQIEVDGSIRMSRPESLFEVVVKWVCGDCNSSWMNRLDDAVEPWIFNPYEDSLKPDPLKFRLWAIKVAVLRSYYDSPLLPQPEDIRAIYDREDIPEWHIFVGQMAVPNHTHTQVGFGPVDPVNGGRFDGIAQITWSLGRVMVTALRVVGASDRTINYLNRFRQHNISEGVVVTEVLPNAARFPSVALLPKIAMRGYMSLAWYFSTHPLSPVAREMLAIDADLRRAAKDRGFTPLRI